jgi:hypothetical protein
MVSLSVIAVLTEHLLRNLNISFEPDRFFLLSYLLTFVYEKVKGPWSF